MNSGSATPSDEYSRWAQSRPSGVIGLTPAALSTSTTPERVIHALHKITQEDASSEGLDSDLFKIESASDIMEYSEWDIVQLEVNENRDAWDASVSQPSLISTPKKIVIPAKALSYLDIKSRDESFISLSKESGWAKYMQSFFMKQLLRKKEEGKHHLNLYLTLEDIIADVFDLYSRKNDFLESWASLIQETTFLELIQDRIGSRIDAYNIANTGKKWGIEKRVYSLGEKLNGFIAVRERATPEQIQKYGNYIGQNPGARISPFELSILRTIKQIEQILNTTESSPIEKSASTADLITVQKNSTQIRAFTPEHNLQLAKVLDFLKDNFSDLKHQQWELYHISLGLYDLSRTIQKAAKIAEEAPIKKEPLGQIFKKKIQTLFTLKP